MFECKIGLKRCTLRGGLRFAFSWSDHFRIMVGSLSDRPALAITFQLFSKIFFKKLRIEFCVAGAIFGEVGW